MIKVGMNMLLWTDHVTEKHFGKVDELKAIGYDGIELFLGQGDEKHYSMLGNQFSNIQMGVTCVASLNPEENIASPNKAYRAAGLDRLKWSIDMGEALNAEVICGPFHSSFAYFSREAPTETEKQRSVEMLQKAAEYAAKANIVLAAEALNRFECYLYNTVSDLNKLVASVNHPSFGAMYDTHHGNIEEKSQSDAIKTISPNLKHIHISENDRGTPGSGQVNWEEVFQTIEAINYSGWLTIEAFSRLAPDFANAINVWRDFSPTEQIYKDGFKFIKEQMKTS